MLQQLPVRGHATTCLPTFAQ